MRVYKASRFVIAEDLYEDKPEAIFIKGDLVVRGEKCKNPMYILVSDSDWTIHVFDILYRIINVVSSIKSKISPKKVKIDYNQNEKFDV
jgi:hypothetical protein